MRNSSFISRFSGLFILLLFTLSVTPKRFLHDALANHRDAVHSISNNDPQFYASGFQCHADDLVVEAPFLPGTAQLTGLIIFSRFFVYASPLLLQTVDPVPASGVRGPPAAMAS